MFFKTEADRASAQAAKARHDAGEAGSNAATGARNLGAAVLATLAEATAPADDRKGKKHAQRARARAVKAARKDREAAGKAANKAAGHGRKAAELGRAAADKRAGKAGGTLSTLADAAGLKAAGAAGTAKVAGSQLASKMSSSELADRARKKAAHARESAAERSGPLADSAREKATASAALVAALAAAARQRADETRTRALLGVDAGIDAAVPRAQDGVAAVGPRVDHLRDVINTELLPKLQEMLGDVQTNKDRLLTKDEGAVAALTGTPKKKSRKGGVLITFGLLAAVGAGIAWYLSQQQKSATDPWASQAGGADPWASRTPTSAADPIVDTTTATTTGTPPAAAAGTTGGASGDAPRLLDSEEIDALAADTPSTAEEQTPGESPTEEIETARREAGPAATDIDAGEVDEGQDPGAPRA